MRWSGSKWNGIVVWAVTGACPALLAAGLFSGWPTAVFVLLGCGTSTLLICIAINRAARSAEALLRRPELRSTPGSQAGIHGPLVREAIDTISRLEREVEEATRSRTSLEARNQVRLKDARRLEAALNSLDEPLFLTDGRDRIHFCNSAAGRLLRPAAATNEDKPLVAERLPELAPLVAETRTRNVATDSRKTDLELKVNGTTLHYRATAVNIYDVDQKPIGVAAVLHDTCEEHREKTRHAEFVSSVCHELKTPMASIKAYTEMLLDGDVTEEQEQQEVFGFIDGQVDRLTRLTNNMLNLARIESGVIKVQREDRELNSVMHKAFAVVQPTAEEKQIRMISELSELYMPVHLDADLFGQAIINLLSNAVKYTPSGGEVRLRSRMDETEAVIEVRDNGMGIPEDSLPKIFERFYRVPENNKAAAGTGLGLALVKYIVTELCNGSISVASVRNEGSTFTVRIPLGHVDQHRKKHREPAVCAS